MAHQATPSFPFQRGGHVYQRFLHVFFDLLWAVLLSRWFERLIRVLGSVLGLLVALGLAIIDLLKPRKKRKAG